MFGEEAVLRALNRDGYEGVFLPLADCPEDVLQGSEETFSQFFGEGGHAAEGAAGCTESSEEREQRCEWAAQQEAGR